jgi:hypothetical protein
MMQSVDNRLAIRWRGKGESPAIAINKQGPFSSSRGGWAGSRLPTMGGLSSGTLGALSICIIALRLVALRAA